MGQNHTKFVGLSALVNDSSSAVCSIHVRRLDYEILLSTRFSVRAVERTIGRAIERVIEKAMSGFHSLSYCA